MFQGACGLNRPVVNGALDADSIIQSRFETGRVGVGGVVGVRQVVEASTTVLAKYTTIQRRIDIVSASTAHV
jgi:hypothetical protein